ncbi:MAG: septum formation initiator family protein [Verrucomicrobia bacterium]|nr:septum formation initiator family protein [Verrucomicrobiota bacterium]
MNVNLGIWGKLTRAIVCLLLLAAVMGVAVWYLPLIRQNEAMRKEILELRQQIHKEQDTVRQLKGSLDALRDPRTVERLARERLGYAKPGETVIRFGPPATNGPPARP